MADSPDPQLREARLIIEGFLQIRPSLRGPTVVASLRDALGAAERQWTLYLLLLVDDDLVRELLPELLVAGLRARDALLVREVVGRLPRSVLKAQLFSLIRRRLPTADDEEFRRMAELLHHLGLQAELADLLAIAKESDDSDIREVAADFSPYGMSSLQVILSRLEESDEDQTIYAAEPWNPESDALLAIEGNPEADAALDAGLRYFIEVSIAQDVIETWIHWRNGRIPTPLEIANAVIFYATNDSYLLP